MEEAKIQIARDVCEAFPDNTERVVQDLQIKAFEGCFHIIIVMTPWYIFAEWNPQRRKITKPVLNNDRRQAVDLRSICHLYLKQCAPSFQTNWSSPNPNDSDAAITEVVDDEVRTVMMRFVLWWRGSCSDDEVRAVMTRFVLWWRGSCCDNHDRAVMTRFVLWWRGSYCNDWGGSQRASPYWHFLWRHERGSVRLPHDCVKVTQHHNNVTLST